MQKIIRNYLEIKSLDKLFEVKKPNEDYYLEKVIPSDYQLNKFFYKQIGKSHKWVDRLEWNDSNWIKYVSNKNVSTFVLKKKLILLDFLNLFIIKINPK